MTRSIWKGNFINSHLLTDKFENKNKKIVWSRNSTIPESLVGQAVFIHNGKDFIKSYITREKVGFKFGEFAYTRKFTKKQDKVKTKKKGK
jgi:small subunit ribosomal protein S19